MNKILFVLIATSLASTALALDVIPPPATVPEPGSFALLAMAGTALAIVARLKRRK